MVFLIGLLSAIALLYFWLIGHWFARILAFLLFVPVVVVCAGRAFPNSVDQVGAILILVCLIALAWPIASIPIYVWRWRARATVAGISLDRGA